MKPGVGGRGDRKGRAGRREEKKRQGVQDEKKLSPGEERRVKKGALWKRGNVNNKKGGVTGWHWRREEGGSKWSLRKRKRGRGGHQTYVLSKKAEISRARGGGEGSMPRERKRGAKKRQCGGEGATNINTTTAAKEKERSSLRKGFAGVWGRGEKKKKIPSGGTDGINKGENHGFTQGKKKRIGLTRGG